MPEHALVIPATTIRAALAHATARLAETSETPRLDAELLLAHVLGIDRARLFLDPDNALEPDRVATLDALVARRAAHEPVAYILGRRGFRHLDLTVDPRVLVPRPETELLVEVALTLPPRASVLDVGTGSGAIALAVKDERPDLTVTGVDISSDALTVARDNAARLGLDVAFARSDLLADAPRADAILANLPYVEDDAPLPPDVAAHEPGLALFGGDDGLDLVRRLVQQAGARRHRPLIVALEIAPHQAAATAELMGAAGFAPAEILRDLSGRDRVVVGRT